MTTTTKWTHMDARQTAALGAYLATEVGSDADAHAWAELWRSCYRNSRHGHSKASVYATVKAERLVNEAMQRGDACHASRAGGR